MSLITEEYNIIPPDVQTQMLIAPVLSEMIADRAFSIGNQFIVDSVLYKATTAITQGSALVVGTNCAVSDTIDQQIKDVEQQIEDVSFGLNWVMKGKSTTGTATWGAKASSLKTILDNLTLSQIMNSRLVAGTDIYYPISLTKSVITYALFYMTPTSRTAFSIYLLFPAQGEATRINISASGTTIGDITSNNTSNTFSVEVLETVKN